MIGKLDPEEHVMSEPTLHQQIASAIRELGWEEDDDVVVEIGGTSVYEIPGAGTKWAPLKGTRKYNKDAFIVIKNKSRDEMIFSNPDPTLKAHHLKTETELAAEIKKEDDAKNYDTYSK